MKRNKIYCRIISDLSIYILDTKLNKLTLSQWNRSMPSTIFYVDYHQNGFVLLLAKIFELSLPFIPFILEQHGWSDNQRDEYIHL